MDRHAHDEYRALLAIRHTPRIGPRTWKRILEHFPSAVEAARNASGWPELGLTSVSQSRAFRDRAWRDAASLEYEAARDYHDSVLPFSSPEYPELLRNIPDPPACLYALGDVSLLSGPGVAVVGARQATPYGLRSTREIARALSASGVTVVSGMARGIDREAHLGGLEGSGSTVCVLGTGPERIYPSSNADIYRSARERGCVVTEFPPGTIPARRNFPVRNRIISGLSLGVLVAEAAEDSGSLITARNALEQGREIFALPGPLGERTFRGCHNLIRQGALLVSGAEDILKELGFRLAANLPQRSSTTDDPEGGIAVAIRPDSSAGAPTSQSAASCGELDDTERNLLEALDGGERLHIDQLGRETGLESSAVSRALVGLQIKRLVRQWPGMYYSLITE